ncbi:unnamed protein product [Notodromas monacha]|uniref:EF-hand domain-containing protein n=1 Tax=Notodromas monacha TaxID=399045 RepID=A0A7R9BLK1_9CRUS|nr:unnamed protein product [Notodromas monacha]CAG0916378.1 unnamed protein product [Notodromas monacha]
MISSMMLLVAALSRDQGSILKFQDLKMYEEGEDEEEPLPDFENETLNFLEDMRCAYKEKVLPLERKYRFEDFYTRPLNDNYFGPTALVLLVGPMGSGRSLFVADYVQKDFVATNTRAAINEPNDIMSIVTYGQDDWVLPGERAFKSCASPVLERIGSLVLAKKSIADKVQVITCNSPALQYVTIIDFPGIPWGTRSKPPTYEYLSILKYLAKKADRIFLFFNARAIPDCLSPHVLRSLDMMRFSGEKMSIVYTKSLDMDPAEFLRNHTIVYWTVGTTMASVTPPKTYCRKWSEGEYEGIEEEEGEGEGEDRDAGGASPASKTKKLSGGKGGKDAKGGKKLSGGKAGKDAKADKDKDKKKTSAGKAGKGKEAGKRKPGGDDRHRGGEDEGEEEEEAEDEGNIAADAMMGEEELMFQLKYAFLLTLHRKMWELEHRASLAQIHAQVLSALVENFPSYEDEKTQQKIRSKRIYELDSIYNRLQCQLGLFCEYFPDTSYMRYDYRNSYLNKWALFKPAVKYENLFNELNKKHSKVNIVDADPAIKMFNLPDWVDEKIWRMADIDRDGMLDRDEFVLAMHLMFRRTCGLDIPSILPVHLIPYAKRMLLISPESDLDPRRQFADTPTITTAVDASVVMPDECGDDFNWAGESSTARQSKKCVQFKSEGDFNYVRKVLDSYRDKDDEKSMTSLTSCLKPPTGRVLSNC